ncbi:MAG: hypothetical protein NHG12_00695 [Candidatus Shikimatogenerans bostrichidophilus]|nr:MAG: hypothetical protein NHG12_00695 [Candidatus Shikimatogenerans bostrichidophilus]
MTYILNINENDNNKLSNISLNYKLLFKIIIINNNIHENIKNLLIKKKFNLNKINAICVNNGPSLSYIKIRSILSTVKGICLSLNKPLIVINDFIIIINNKINLFKNFKIIFFIIFSYNKKIIYLKKYNIKKKKLYKKKIINNLYKKKIFKKYLFFLNKKNKKNININYFKKKIFFYKINYNNIIYTSYKLYKKKKFIKNINKCEPIYI